MLAKTSKTKLGVCTVVLLCSMRKGSKSDAAALETVLSALLLDSTCGIL